MVSEPSVFELLRSDYIMAFAYKTELLVLTLDIGIPYFYHTCLKKLNKLILLYSCLNIAGWVANSRPWSYTAFCVFWSGSKLLAQARLSNLHGGFDLKNPSFCLKRQENLHLKMSSVYVVCWIFLQSFQTYFCIQANSVDPGSTLFAEMTFKITSRWQSRRQRLSFLILV